MSVFPKIYCLFCGLLLLENPRGFLGVEYKTVALILIPISSFLVCEFRDVKILEENLRMLTFDFCLSSFRTT